MLFSQEEYVQYLQDELQAAKQHYDKSLEVFKEAERRIIGTQYALQSYLTYQNRASEQVVNANVEIL